MLLSNAVIESIGQIRQDRLIPALSDHLFILLFADMRTERSMYEVITMKHERIFPLYDLKRNYLVLSYAFLDLSR